MSLTEKQAVWTLLVIVKDVSQHAYINKPVKSELNRSCKIITKENKNPLSHEVVLSDA